MLPDLQWTWARFDDLGVHALHDALALRCRVFILEQGPYQDPDDADKHAWHLLWRSADGTLQALLRVVDPGVNYEQPSIGRVVVAPELRADAGITRESILLGMGSYLELWDAQTYAIKEAEAKQAEMPDVLNDFSF